MATIVLGDIVKVIKEPVNPRTCGFDKFVGLEHYDAGEPMITRYASPDNLDSSVKHFGKGDILVARRNVYLKRAGYVDFEGVTSGDSIVLRVTDKSYQRILPFILNTDDFWDYAEQNSDGTMSKRLSPDDLLDYEFEEPQDKELLADKLWAAYRVKESYRRLISATDDMVKAKFLEMFDYKPLDLSGNTANFDTYCKDFTSKAEKIPAGDYLKNGKYAIFDQSQDSYIAGYTDCEDGVCLNYPCVLFGDHSRAIKYIDEPYFIGADGVKIVKPIADNIIPKFLYYDLLYHEIPNTGYNRHFKYLKMVHLTEASIDEQQQFVDIAIQAEATKASLRQSIESIDKVIRSLINQ